MISIIKYIKEMISDDEENVLGKNLEKQYGPEYNKRLQMMKQQEKQPGTGTKVLKKTIKSTLKPAPPPTPTVEEPAIYTNPIKKFINAVRQ